MFDELNAYLSICAYTILSLGAFTVGLRFSVMLSVILTEAKSVDPPIKSYARTENV